MNLLRILNKAITDTEEPFQTISEDEARFVIRELGAMRDQLVDRIWVGIALIVLIGVPISISRSTITGWIPLYTAHVIIGAVALSIYGMRQRLSLRVKVTAIFVMFWAVGLVGLIQLGPFGAGLWWLSVTPFIASALISIRVGILMMFAVLLTVAAVGYCYVNGLLSTGIDASAYESGAQAWATLLIGACLMPLIVFHAISLLSRQVTELSLRKHQNEQELKAQRDKLSELAFRDELTGAATRRVMKDRLGQKIKSSTRSSQKSALLSMDLNGFKPLNDTYGHVAGDEMLKSVVHRISAIVRPADTVARYGGDEFVVLLDSVHDVDEAIEVASRIANAIAQPLYFDDNELVVSASIGVVLLPDHGKTVQELIDRADQAMYQAKKQSGATSAPAVRLSAVKELRGKASEQSGRIESYGQR